MTDRPIIFSAPMVRALLDGRKTQTRRIVKVPGILGGRYPILPPEEAIELEDGEFSRGTFHYASTGALSGPYRLPAAVGDRLYVREEYYQRGHWEPVPGRSTKGGRQKWAFIPADQLIRFDAPPGHRKGRHHADPVTIAWHKRLARFMPCSASRLTLIVEGVKVERLQDISRSDAIAEGIQRVGGGMLRWENWTGAEGQSATSPQAAYALLWNSLHGAGSWDDNPFVVALTFRVERGNIDKLEQAA
jgi:hypothetical protein